MSARCSTGNARQMRCALTALFKVASISAAFASGRSQKTEPSMGLIVFCTDMIK
jgi:hypothetical protein